MPTESVFTAIRRYKFAILELFQGGLTLNDLNNISYIEAVRLNNFVEKMKKNV